MSDLGLEARDNLLWIARHWPDLQAALGGGGGNALTGMASGDGDPIPINVNVSDLMREIEDFARHHAWVLMELQPEPPFVYWLPSTSRMPDLLAEVAQCHEAITADEREGLDFTDEASEFRRKVDGILFGREPRKYLGPCPTPNCAGELTLRALTEAETKARKLTGIQYEDEGRCRLCGVAFTEDTQKLYLRGELAERRMTLSEIVSALLVLGAETPYRTVQSWAARGKLIPEDGLYKLADAHALATRGKVAA